LVRRDLPPVARERQWRALTPFQDDTTASKLIPIYEYTLGGPVLRDRLWFFTAGRTVQRTEALTAAAPARIAYDRVRDEKRFEGKLTFTPVSGHAVKGAYLWTKITATNDNSTDELDLQSLTNRIDPGDLRSLNYTGVLGKNLFVEAQYSARNSCSTRTSAPRPRGSATKCRGRSGCLSAYGSEGWDNR
jgi:hypothetical protein